MSDPNEGTPPAFLKSLSVTLVIYGLDFTLIYTSYASGAAAPLIFYYTIGY